MRNQSLKSKNTQGLNLIIFIYLLAFVLMTWSFKSFASSTDKKEAPKKTENPIVIVDTTAGEIHIQLNSEKAPLSTENFLKYVEKKHYDKTIFHRVIKGFMIQGGGHTADLSEKKSEFAPIKNEAKNGLSNKRGAVAMARTNVVDSATAQFFINTVDNKFLDYVSDQKYGYAVFGEVIKGMEVVDKIEAAPVKDVGEMGNVPVKTITINSIRKK